MIILFGNDRGFLKLSIEYKDYLRTDEALAEL